MQEKLSALAAHLTEVEQQLADPAVYTDREKLTALRREVVRLAMLADGHLDGKIFTKAVGRLDEAELLELKRAYEAQIAKKFPVAPQLRQQAETKREDEAVFLV